jgi:hypothetical protein
MVTLNRSLRSQQADMQIMTEKHKQKVAHVYQKQTAFHLRKECTHYPETKYRV